MPRIPIAAKALKAAEMAFGPDDTRVAAALNNLAALYDAQGKYADAVPLLQRAPRTSMKGRSGPTIPKWP